MNTKRIIRAILIPPVTLVFATGCMALVKQIPTEYLGHTIGLVAWMIVSILIYETWK